MKKLTPPEAAAFAPAHLRAWLGGQENLERLVVDWVARTTRWLDGLGGEGAWELLQGPGNGLPVARADKEDGDGTGTDKGDR